MYAVLRLVVILLIILPCGQVRTSQNWKVLVLLDKLKLVKSMPCTMEAISRCRSHSTQRKYFCPHAALASILAFIRGFAAETYACHEFSSSIVDVQ